MTQVHAEWRLLAQVWHLRGRSHNGFATYGTVYRAPNGVRPYVAHRLVGDAKRFHTLADAQAWVREATERQPKRYSKQIEVAS